MAAPVSFDSLPPELIVIILQFLPNAQSLVSAILTCTRIHNAYQISAAELAAQVTMNYVPSEVLPEAWINFQLQRAWMSKDITDVFEIAQKELKERKQPSPEVSLPVALKLCGTQRLVNEFSSTYLAQAFAIPLGSVEMGQHSEAVAVSFPAQSEIYRVQRALYRFEMARPIYSALGHNVDEAELWSLFFSKFASWENEQLACMYDHLFRCILPAFNDLADHDVQWGELPMRHVYEYDSGEIQNVMSRGLVYIQSLMKAITFEQRQKALEFGVYPPRIDFLYDGLRFPNPHAVIDDLELWSQAEYEDFLDHQRPFFTDPSTGPEAAWKWACQAEQPSEFVLANRQRPLREQGYVFYGQARLDCSPNYSKDWQGVEFIDEPDEEVRKREQIGRDRRTKIYWAGGRGWWSAEDESRVVYPNKTKPSSLMRRGIPEWQ